MHCKCQNLRCTGTTGLDDVPPHSTRHSQQHTLSDCGLKTGSGYLHHTQYSLTAENYSNIQKFKTILTKACMHACAQHTTSTVPEHYRYIAMLYIWLYDAGQVFTFVSTFWISKILNFYQIQCGKLFSEAMCNTSQFCFTYVILNLI